MIKAFKEVLEEDYNALVCTDSNLFFLLNLKLDEADQISYRSFQRYKAAALKDDEAEKKELLHQLYVLLRKMAIKQKNNLLKMMLEAKQGWSRIQWLLERKFKEWNIKCQGDIEEPMPGPPPVEMMAPIIPYPQWDTLKAVEDRPLITYNEWNMKWGFGEVV